MSDKDVKFKVVKDMLLTMARDGQDRTVVWDEEQLGFAGKKLIESLAEIGVLEVYTILEKPNSRLLSLTAMGKIARMFLK